MHEGLGLFMSCLCRLRQLSCDSSRVSCSATCLSVPAPIGLDLMERRYTAAAGKHKTTVIALGRYHLMVSSVYAPGTGGQKNERTI